jgi:hypothetical protein
MVVVFLQGICGLSLHLDVQGHYYCSTHQRVTHDAEHAREANTSHTDGSLASERAHAPPSPDDDRPNHDEDGHGDECQWLTWMHETSVSYPPVYAQLLNLPPPAERLDAPRTDASRVEQRPIALRRLAPNKSPPPAFA